LQDVRLKKREKEKKGKRGKAERIFEVRQGTTIFVTGHEGPWRSRLSHFLENRLIDGGEVVGLMHRPELTPREDS
jgi:hypothetical protein